MARVDEVAVIRIVLQGIEPLIWRRVAVRTATSLSELHRVVQAAMGWLDCHLWELEVGEKRYGMRIPEDADWDERHESAERTALAELLHAGVHHLEYVYDMGDFWEHAIIIEKVAAPLPGVRYPQFLGGERRCPPEDCGGPHGYAEFLKNISSKNRKTREGTLKWYGGRYDPDDIGEAAIVGALAQLGGGGSKGPTD